MTLPLVGAHILHGDLPFVETSICDMALHLSAPLSNMPDYCQRLFGMERLRFWAARQMGYAPVLARNPGSVKM